MLYNICHIRIRPNSWNDIFHHKYDIIIFIYTLNALCTILSKSFECQFIDIDSQYQGVYYCNKKTIICHNMRDSLRPINDSDRMILS